MSKALSSCLLHPVGIAPAPIEYPILYSIVCTVKAKKFPYLSWNFKQCGIPNLRDGIS